MLYIGSRGFITRNGSRQRCLVLRRQPYGLHPLDAVLVEPKLVPDAEPPYQLHQRLGADLGHPVEEDDLLLRPPGVVQLVRLESGRL